MFKELYTQRGSEEFQSIQHLLSADVLQYPHLYEYVHIITTGDNNNEVVHLRGSSNSIQPDEMSFADLFSSIRPVNYSECLLLVSLIGHIPKKRILEFFAEHRSRKIKGIDFLPYFSGGLIYRQHLEVLLSIFTDLDKEDIILFIKDWNKKKEAVIAKSKAILINADTSLFDLISEYSPFSEYPFFINPVYKGGHVIQKIVSV